MHVVEATGGEPIRLTDAPLGASEPRFSPDGTRIAYLARVPEHGRYAADGKPGSEDPRHITELKYRSDGVGFFRDRPRTSTSSTSRSTAGAPRRCRSRCRSPPGTSA